MKKTVGIILEVVFLILCIVVAYFLSNYMFATVPIDGNSMEGLLHNEDKVIVYKVGKYKHGDVVIFDTGETYINDAGKETNRYFVKRIIGLPGDTIEIKASPDGEYFVYRNGEKLIEDYLTADVKNAYGAMEVTVIKDGEFFFLGDNRLNSDDSRNDRRGKLDNIVGRVILRYGKEGFFKDNDVIKRVA